jgi:recombinational DNA repair ATPase RecF
MTSPLSGAPSPPTPPHPPPRDAPPPGTVFLYGQTGSGKTFTHEAITRAAVATIFGREEDSRRELAAVVLSVVEIHCEAIRCLLTGREVALRQGQRGGGLLLEGAGEQARRPAGSEGVPTQR